MILYHVLILGNVYMGKWIRAHSRKISFNASSAPENYRKQNKKCSFNRSENVFYFIIENITDKNVLYSFVS